MLTVSKLWHGALYVLAVMLVFSSVVVQLSRQPTAGAISGSCGPNTLFVEPGFGEVLTETRDIKLSVEPPTGTTFTEITAVKFYVGSDPIGNATRENTASNIWRFQWNTQTATNGPKQLSARAFNGSNVLCATDPIEVIIDNQVSSGTSGDLILSRKSPKVREVRTITNISQTFEVRSIFNDGTNSQDVTTAAVYSWDLTGVSEGKILSDPSKPSIKYATGPNPGDARLIVEAQYLDRTDKLVYDIFIEPASTSNYPESSGSTEDDKPLSEVNDDESTATDESESEVIESQSTKTLKEREASNPELKACLIEVLGDSEYEKLVSGERRLSYRELTQVDRCFAATNFVLPANIAPVDPQRVADLPPNTRLASVANAQQVTRDSGTEAILLSGTSIPDSAVVIYIFSEPLVLTTKTDGDGNWTYILEDPLAPGEHQVYVTVENDDEVVRSEPFAFSVEQAASLDTNPTGLSLTLGLSNPQQSSMVFYISGVVAVVLVGVGLYVFVIRRKGDFVDIDEADDPVTKIKT